MKNIFIIITLNIACVFLCFSQPTPKQLTDEEPRNYDVLKYDLSVDWVDIMPTNKGEIDKRHWDAKLEITLTPLQNNFSLVELDAIELKINKIWINDNELKDIPDNSNGILAIPIPTLNIGDTVTILLDYTYNNPYNIGFFHRNSLINYFDEEIDAPLAGTLCEPQDSRYWLPCNDRPNDKAIVNIAATVPAWMLAAANGSLDSTVTIQQNNIPYSTTFYWTSKHPMPPYLMTIAVAEYVLHTEKIPISSAKEDSVDVYYYTWEHCWDGMDYSLSSITASTNKTMQIFSDLFGDYPFEKYGIATTDYSLLGYGSLGMEHQTLTTINLDWAWHLMPIPEFTSFAHELAHSWFGNMVTCYTWKDIWFNEGGASWLEAVYLENIRDFISTGEYYNHMKNHRSTYLRGKSSIYEQPLYLADGVDAFSNSALIYSKAGWVFHQLRMLLGDDVFGLFKQLLEEHKFANITSQEFVDFFVNNVPDPPNNVDIKRFLEQFIFKAGHPIYNINSNVTKTNDGYNVDVVLNQMQSANNVPDEFLMKLNIAFLDKNNNIIYTDSIINDKRQQSYQFKLASEPAKVILDTTKALFEVSGNFLLDDISTYNSDILIYPNPINNDKLTIRFQSDAMPINWQQHIELLDISSNSHKITISQMDNNTISMDISMLPAGVYFLKINGSNIYKIIKI